MSEIDSFTKTFTQIIKDYTGGSMDPIYFAILKMIDRDFIGEDEPKKDAAAEGRNILRKKQREILNKKDGDSLDDVSVSSVIALILDDYRLEFNKPEDDRLHALKTPQEVAEWLCRAISDNFLIKTKEPFENGPQNEVEAHLWPLITKQRALLGGIK